MRQRVQASIRSSSLRLALAAGLAACLISGGARADDLDKLSGTSHWRDTGQLHAKTEWLDWYKARVAWRQARHELRLQAARNRYLARLLRRGRPKIGEVQRIMRARLRRPSDAPRRRQVRRRGPTPTRRRAPARAEDEDEDEDRDELETRRGSRSREREPVYRVKPERLDKSGQAIDDEGDAVLRRSGKRR